MPEQVARQADVAAGDRPRTRLDEQTSPCQRHRLDAGHAEVVFGSERAGLGIARPLVAEPEIEADHHVRTPRPPASTSCTNCSGDLRIRCSLKASANRCPTPSSAKRRALTRNGVSGGARSGASTSRGCGSKVITPRKARAVRGRAPGRLDQGPMPAVHAVEITDRDHPVQGGLRQAPIAAVNLHGRLMPVLSGKCKGPSHEPYGSPPSPFVHSKAGKAARRRL